MKKILIVFIAVAALCACTKEPGYVINGQVGNVNGEATLTYALPDGTPVETTVPVNNGAFTFKGNVPDVLSGTIVITPEGGQPTRASLYVENAPLTLVVDPDKVVDYGPYGGLVYTDCKTTGGPNNDFSLAVEEAQDAVGQQPEYKDLADAYNALQEIGYADMALYQQKTAEFQEKFGEQQGDYFDAIQDAMKKVIDQNTDVEASAYMYRIYNSDLPFEELEAGFNRYSEKVRNSFLAKDLCEELAARRATIPGAEAPDFTLNDPEGNPVTLSSLRGQYVIVDFWASWCKPCRAGMPAMKELYAKYHNKGLEIIGVSDDNDHDKWRQAIEQDQTPWIHVVDEFPVENKPARVGSEWGVHYIPSFFLLDKEGKIVGKMDHEELEAKLAELLP